MADTSAALVDPAVEGEEAAGMSKNQKIALGVGAAAAAAGVAVLVGAAGFGTGYVVYKTVKGKKQDASPFRLHVLVKNAKGLENEDTWSLSDPFTVVEVDHVSKRTKTIKDDLNPVWNEELDLGLLREQVEDAETMIKFGVKDEDPGRDESIGHAEMALSSVTSHRKDFTLQLKQGTLNVEMWTSGELPPAPPKDEQDEK
eukprot:TRINITY_DN3649_c0_g1_i1.p1 TRINITY_DN3649_c0_g1~~TRINITY_DN3649_c0_g1_i1.p1  ORF type:complete len:200 (-),score=64.71 TRINITY_DN3649_c0_g1_i1:125-724(-)